MQSEGVSPNPTSLLACRIRRRPNILSLPTAPFLLHLSPFTLLVELYRLNYDFQRDNCRSTGRLNGPEGVSC
jgi:hypothetical protein